MDSEVVLDFRENLRVSKENAEEYYDARMALARLAEGLFWLYDMALNLERQVQALAASRGNPQLLIGLHQYGLPVGRLSSIFQWYAVSACNYAQLVGWLATSGPKEASAYVRRVMPRISQYPNKVGAHFAATSPRGDDNEADLVASIMTHLIYARGRLCAAGLSREVKDQNNGIAVSQEFTWSLTLAHELLTPRYWPAGPPKISDALQIPPGLTTPKFRWLDPADGP